MMTRREFLKKTAIVAGGVLIPLSALEILSPERLQAIKADEAVRWAFLVDTQNASAAASASRPASWRTRSPTTPR